MDLAGIVIGILGVFIGILGLIYAHQSHRASKIIEEKLIAEVELIRDKILDLRQIWIGYRDRILNDRKTFNNDKRNQLEISIRIEDIDGHIAVLDRFAERLNISKGKPK